jgi:glutamate N-acetyltransferase/amino-acid N-acetyltransferase
MIRRPERLHKRRPRGIFPPMSSELAEIANGSVTSPRGFSAAAAPAGLKADGTPDVALLVSATSCATAGVFTKNAVRAAPVIYDAELLAERPGRIRAVAMNARVANACTGAPGLAAARAMALAAEQAAGLPARTALVLSTGVIGVPLPLEQVAAGLRAAATHLSPDGGPDAARAIMTTDTRPKYCAVRFETPAGMITVGGIAKGAGMIHPDMATLLAVLTTDAAGEPAALQPLLRRVADRTFNAISVDGDTSTNDTVLLLAGGASGVDPARDGALWKAFEDAVQHVARVLALAIVADGEGASKLVEIQVVGAVSEAAAREVGRAVARSTLVKTAIYGADPNWGRILAAAGAAGVTLAVERLSLQVGDADGEWLTLASGGATAHADVTRARALFQQKTIRLRIDLGLGRAEAVVWTCDLTPDYVRINADYTS